MVLPRNSAHRSSRDWVIHLSALFALLIATAGCQRVWDLITGTKAASGTPQVVYSASPWHTELDLSPLDALKEDVNLESIIPTTDSEDWAYPEGTPDGIRQIMDQFLVEPTLTELLRLPNKKLPSHLCFDINRNGNHLYVVDKEDMITVVEVDTKKVLARVKSPLEKTYGLLVDVQGEQLFLINPVEVVKFDWKNEKTLATIDAPEGFVAQWNRATKVNKIGAVTLDGLLFFIDGDSMSLVTCEKYRMESKTVAIHPEGKFVLGTLSSQALRWYPESENQMKETMTFERFATGYTPINSGFDADRWFDSVSMHEFQGDKLNQALPVYGKDPFYMGISAYQAACCYNQINGWSVVVGKIMNGKLPLQTVVASIDMDGSRYICSKLLPLDADRVDRLRTNTSGSRIAIYTESGIQVLQRPVFDDPTGLQMVTYIGQYAYEDKLELLEQIGQELRKRNWPSKMVTGEELYGNLIEKIAYAWKWTDSNPNEPESPKIAEQFRQWYEKGGEVAKCASALRYYNIGLSHRGGGYADTVSDHDFDEFHKYLRKANPDVVDLMKLEKPPFTAFELKLDLMKEGIGDNDDLIQVVTRCIKLYPANTKIHSLVLLELLPRWGGSPGAGERYLNYVCQLYPQAIRDQVYANSIAGLTNPFGPTLVDPNEGNFDFTRMIRGGESLLDDGLLTRDTCERIIAIAYYLHRMPEVTRLADYHITNFASASKFAYNDNGRYGLLSRRITHLDAYRVLLNQQKAEQERQQESSASDTEQTISDTTTAEEVTAQ